MTGIYKITNTINHKIYIGQASDYKKRIKSHKSTFNRFIKTPEKHTSGCRFLYKAFKKYGLDNFIFELIEICEIDSLNEREQYWLDFYKSYEPKNGYNLARIAGSSLGIKRSDETKKKISDLAKKRIGDKNPFFGKQHSAETKEKIRKTKTGSKMPPGFKEKWSKYNIWELNKKEILQYDIWGKLIKKWDSLKDACEYTNIKVGRISECLHKKQPTAGGYIWLFNDGVANETIEINLSNSSIKRNINKYYNNGSM